jgi:UDP-4-amino-4,6-dideoxy-N-acetyl-beta-L-altrosamine N-acetyltransferase
MLESCSVREMTEDDLHMVLSWRNHDAVRRFMFSPNEISLKEHLNWFASSSNDPTKCVLIFEVAKEALGFVQFSQVASRGVSEWGFYVSPEAPKGTGRKLGVTALNYAFAILGLNKVLGKVISMNKASVDFHRRLGFTLEGVLTDHQLIDGTYSSLYCFGMFASDWTLQKHKKD